MIEGSCHCGKVGWSFDGIPEGATACNCTVCRRYGALWAHDYEGHRVRVWGPTLPYVRGKTLGYHFCPHCGCVAYSRGLALGDDGRRWIAINLRLAQDPEAIGAIAIDHFEGLNSFEDLPRDGRCVTDMWF